MNSSKHVMVTGRNNEVVLVKADAYSAFCQIGYATMFGDVSVEEFSKALGEDHYDSLAAAYKQDQWNAELESSAAHFDNVLALTEDAGIAFLALVLLANENPELVNRTAMNAGAAGALTGVC